MIIAWALGIALLYFFVDKPLAWFCYGIPPGSWLYVPKIISVAGIWYLYVGLFFLLGLFFRYVAKNKLFEGRAWYLFGCVLFPSLLNAFLKVALGRARPELLFTQEIFGFYFFEPNSLYWSFPSGHAVTITALCTGLALLFPRYKIIYWVAIVLVMSSRVVLGRHYLGDVIAGMYLSLLVVGLWTAKYRAIQS
jgi:membrane-associated phospholipid phosphatase